MRSFLSFATPLACALFAASGCSSSGPGGGDQPGPDGGTEPAPDGAPRPDAAPGPDAMAIDAGIDAPQVQDLTVCATGGADFDTIGAAVASANPGSTIRLCAGTYHERLRIAKPLILIGTAGAPSTVIDGEDLDTVVTIADVGGAGVTLDGVTLRHGRTAAEGGGLRCATSKLTMTGVALDANRAETGGGGLYATGCELDVRSAQVTGNVSNLFGGGMLLDGSTGTIADGRFSGNDAHDVGGAIATRQGDLTIINNVIRENVGHRGGGIHTSGAVRIHGNQIIANTARWTGGGLHLVGSAPMVTSNVIAENTSPNDGGGIYLDQSNATLMNNEVRANVSGDDGGGVRVFESMATLTANLVEQNQAADGGGGIRVSHVPSVLVDNLVRDNIAGGTGGGMDLDNDASLVRGGEIRGNRAGGSGGGIFAWLGPWDGHRFEDITIAENRAWQGGGIYLVDNFKPVQMRRLKLLGNRAGHGGAIMVRATDFTLTGSLVADNHASQRGGGILAGSSEPWMGTDGVTGMCPCPPVAPAGQITFSVIARNDAARGAGLWTSLPGLQVGNTILFANEGPASIEAAPDEFAEAPAVPGDGPTMDPPAAVPQITYSDILPATFAGMMDPTTDHGNLSVDPAFVDAPNDDFHLAPGSACIDTGAPFLFDGDGTRSDMGMFGGAP